MSQTSYTRDFTQAYAGMLGDNGDRRIEARINNQGADLAAGIFVKNSAEGLCTLLSSAGDKLAGVVVNTFAHNPGDASKALTAGTVIEAGEMANVLTDGAVWVVCEEAMAVTDPVYARHTAGTGTTIGAVRNDIDTASCILVKGARVLVPSTGAGVCCIFLSLNAALT